MRSVSSTVTVRLYHFDMEGGVTTTLAYAPLAEALAIAAAQPPEVQDALFIQTDNDVVAYPDFLNG